MSEFSRLIPRIPEHIGFPTTEAAILDLAREFQITVRNNQAIVLDRLKNLAVNGVRDGTSAYQAISLDDVAYARWLAHNHVTFDFYGSMGYADFVHEHSARTAVSLSVFEERLRKLVETGYTITRSTLKNALANAVFSPRQSPKTATTNIGLPSTQVRDNSRLKDVVVEKPERVKPKKRTPFIYSGERFPDLVGREFKNKTEFVREIGTAIHITVVRMRLAKGWHIDDAVSLDDGLRGATHRKRKRSGKARKLRPVVKIARDAKIPVIYVATSKTTGLKFVGATRKNSPLVTWRGVLDNAKKNAHLHAALSQLDKKDFTIETVDVVADGDVAAARGRWIARLGTLFPNGYNTAR